MYFFRKEKKNLFFLPCFCGAKGVVGIAIFFSLYFLNGVGNKIVRGVTKNGQSTNEFPPSFIPHSFSVFAKTIVWSRMAPEVGTPIQPTSYQK